MTSNSELKWELVVITGASGGIGGALAVAFAQQLRGAAHFILVGRDVVRLENTKASVFQARSDRPTKCEVFLLDLSQVDVLSEAAASLFTQENPSVYQRVILINNAASLGTPGFIGHHFNLEGVKEAMNVNVIAPYILVSQLIKKYHKTDAGVRIRIVNMTTFWAIDPARSFSHYCSSKASAEMLFRVLAIENDPQMLKVLNYAPGVVDTQLQRIVRTHPNADPTIKANCAAMFESGNMVNISSTANKCVRLVLEDSYVSGGHVDYFDEVEGIDYPKQSPTNCCSCPTCKCGPHCQCKSLKSPQCDPCSYFMLNNI